MSTQSQKPSTWLLFACLVTVMLGFGIFPLMPFYIAHFGTGSSALGLLMAIYSVMAPLWGAFRNTPGRVAPFYNYRAGQVNHLFSSQGLFYLKES